MAKSYLEMLTILLAQPAGKPSVKFEYKDETDTKFTIWRDTTDSNNAFIRGDINGFSEPYAFTEADLNRTYTEYVVPPPGPEMNMSKGQRRGQS